MVTENGGPDLEVYAKLTISEMMNGVRKDVRVRTAIQCASCQATGGTNLPDKPCPTCEGHGRIAIDQIYSVDSPAGTDEGSTLRLTGLGAVGWRGGRPGDLYVNIGLVEDPLFEKSGKDLYRTLTVQTENLVAGTKISLENANGKGVSFCVPEGYTPGQRVRLTGQGLSDCRGVEKVGDLYVSLITDSVASSTPKEHIFISYSSEDVRYVKNLAAFLGSQGIPTWIDEDGIDHGSQWTEIIRENIDTCIAMIVVMSSSSEKSLWVDREIQRAEDKAKPILPLLLQGEKFFRLGVIQYEDVSDRGMPNNRFLKRLRWFIENGSSGT